MKHLMPTIVVSLLASAIIGCGARDAVSASGSSGLGGKLVVTGSSTVAPLAVEIGKRFEQSHAGVRIDVQTGGTSRGLTDIHVGMAQLAMASRALQPTEKETGLREHPIGADGIGLIVHADNLLSELSSAQVVAIFTAKTRLWKELGGSDSRIVVINKAEGRATLHVFQQHFGLQQGEIVADVIGGENQQVIQTVAGNPAAIGYVSIGEANAEQAAGTPIKLLVLDGNAPTAASVVDGTYPLRRPLNFVSNGEPVGLAKAFLEFAQSEEVYDLVEQQGFVPLSR